MRQMKSFLASVKETCRKTTYLAEDCQNRGAQHPSLPLNVFLLGFHVRQREERKHCQASKVAKINVNWQDMKAKHHAAERAAERGWSCRPLAATIAHAKDNWIFKIAGGRCSDNAMQKGLLQRFLMSRVKATQSGIFISASNKDSRSFAAGVVPVVPFLGLYQQTLITLDKPLPGMMMTDPCVQICMHKQQPFAGQTGTSILTPRGFVWRLKTA